MTAFESFWPWRLRQRNTAPPDHHSTAQELYKSMIDERISPALRALGLKGSGGRYELASTSHWALLAFQKSAYSDRDEIRFTINLAAIRRDVWERETSQNLHWGKRPSAGTHYGKDFPSTRIGLAAGREDTWWKISGAQSVDVVVDDVLADVEQHGLPWLIATMGSND